jgi:hypothetical protein
MKVRIIMLLSVVVLMSGLIKNAQGYVQDENLIEFIALENDLSDYSEALEEYAALEGKSILWHWGKALDRKIWHDGWESIEANFRFKDSEESTKVNIKAKLNYVYTDMAGESLDEVEDFKPVTIEDPGLIFLTDKSDVKKGTILYKDIVCAKRTGKRDTEPVNCELKASYFRIINKWNDFQEWAVIWLEQ